jgi:DNA replication protein DnaC
MPMDRSSDLEKAVAKTLADATPSTMREPLADREVDCDRHGPYISSGVRYMGKREVWTPCPACEEARIADARHTQALQEAERARGRLEQLLGEAHIPARFIGRSLDNFQATTDEQRAALEVVREFVKNFEQHRRKGTTLILSGLPGTGKSHLATAALQALMPNHCGLYTTCMNVIRAVRGTWRKDSPRSETEVLNIYAHVPLLVLDEIGVQYGTDGEQTILFDVLDRRYRDMQPSILLTNQNQKGFADFIGERTYDRMRETSTWVPFDWPSFRPQAKKDAA